MYSKTAAVEYLQINLVIIIMLVQVISLIFCSRYVELRRCKMSLDFKVAVALVN
jgi:hypothetical protein